MKYKVFAILFFFFFGSAFSLSAQNAESVPESVSIEVPEKTPIALTAEKKNETELPKNLFLDTAGKLLIVLGVIYLLFLLLRKFSPGLCTARYSSRTFGVTASIPLTGKSRLVLVRFGTKLLLLAVNGDRTVKIAETADPQEADAIMESFSESNRNK